MKCGEQFEADECKHIASVTTSSTSGYLSSELQWTWNIWYTIAVGTLRYSTAVIISVGVGVEIHTRQNLPIGSFRRRSSQTIITWLIFNTTQEGKQCNIQATAKQNYSGSVASGQETRWACSATLSSTADGTVAVRVRWL